MFLNFLCYFVSIEQTDEEKKIRKQLRREEKKLEKRRKGEGDDEDEEYIKALGFTPDELRAQRCVIITKSMII